MEYGELIVKNFIMDNKTRLNLAALTKKELLDRLNFMCDHRHNGLAHPGCYNKAKGKEERIAFYDAECVIPGTLILTKDGLKKIEEINKGEFVLTHKNKWQKVTETYKNKYDGDIYNIGYNKELSYASVTPNHPFLCGYHRIKRGGDRKKKHNMQTLSTKWINAEDVSIDNLLMGVKNEEAWIDIKHIEIGEKPEKDQHKTSDIKNKLEIDDDFLKVIGLFLGDGYADNESIQIFPNIKDSEFIEILKRWAKKIGAYNISIVEQGKMYKVTICSSRLAKFFLQFYNKNKEKYIPLEWINLPTERFINIVYGLYLSDGYRQKRETHTERSICNSSIELLKGISIRLSFTDYVTTVRKARKSAENIFPGGKKYLCKDGYSLRFDLEHENYKSKIQWFLVDYIFRRIKHLDKTNFNGYVYNLHVENDESYIANGIITHNTSHLRASIGYIISYCIKPLNGKVITRIVTTEEIQNGTYDKRLCKQFVKDIQQFDRIVGHYSSRFDLPFFRTRCVLHGIDFPLYMQKLQSDTWLILRHKFQLHSNRLEAACIFFDIPAKGHPLNGRIWQDAMTGKKKALDYILIHNIEDVVCLEELWKKIQEHASIRKMSI